MFVEVNTQTANSFYQAFQKKDYKAMQALYAPKATFNDPAFQNLNETEVKAMWEMLLRNAQDFSLTYQILEATAQQLKVQWIATYTFSRTKRKVINNIQALLTFDFYKWATQAFGTTGLLIGWTSFFKNKVRKTVRQQLDTFINKNKA